MKEYEFVKEFVGSLTDLANKKNIKKLKVTYKDIRVFIDMVGNEGGVFLNSEEKMPVVGSKNENKPGADFDGKAVISPIVGTFYDSPAPGKPPFVKLGDSVKKGDILFIIESMKLMNEIKSEFDGIITDILVESGDGVEYGQPIMIVKQK